MGYFYNPPMSSNPPYTTQEPQKTTKITGVQFILDQGQEVNGPSKREHHKCTALIKDTEQLYTRNTRAFVVTRFAIYTILK
jgi:hypothetical protein